MSDPYWLKDLKSAPRWDNMQMMPEDAVGVLRDSRFYISDGNWASLAFADAQTAEVDYNLASRVCKALDILGIIYTAGQYFEIVISNKDAFSRLHQHLREPVTAEHNAVDQALRDRQSNLGNASRR